MARIAGIIFIITLCSFGVNSPSLVTFYPMSMQTGNVLLDTKGGDMLVGQGNPYIKNAAAYTDGVSSSYNSLNQLSFKSLTNKFTISFWGKRVTTSSGVFVAGLDMTGAGLTVWNMQNTTAGRLQCAIQIDATNIALTFTATDYTSANVWRHFVATYDGTQVTAANRVLLYVNGVQQATTNTGTVPTALYNPANTTLRVGRSVATYVGDSYIKFLKLYNRPITSTEVMQIYVDEFNKIPQSNY